MRPGGLRVAGALFVPLGCDVRPRNTRERCFGFRPGFRAVRYRGQAPSSFELPHARPFVGRLSSVSLSGAAQGAGASPSLISNMRRRPRRPHTRYSKRQAASSDGSPRGALNCLRRGVCPHCARRPAVARLGRDDPPSVSNSDKWYVTRVRFPRVASAMKRASQPLLPKVAATGALPERKSLSGRIFAQTPLGTPFALVLVQEASPHQARTNGDAEVFEEA